jgi:hypothetical protein
MAYVGYVGFTDVRKAYDTIRRELLLLKFEANGIKGHKLSFLKSIHRGSTCQVKTGETPGILSDTIPMERGLRQGCATSPLHMSLVCLTG